VKGTGRAPYLEMSKHNSEVSTGVGPLGANANETTTIHVSCTLVIRGPSYRFKAFDEFSKRLKRKYLAGYLDRFTKLVVFQELRVGRI
jgi:hypothetical protein